MTDERINDADPIEAPGAAESQPQEHDEQAVAPAPVSATGPTSAAATDSASTTPAPTPATDSPQDEADDFEQPQPPKRQGFGLLLTIVAIGLCGYLLFDLRHEFAYWLTAPSEPVVITNVHLNDAAALDALDNRLVKIYGIPGPSVGYLQDRFAKRELLSLPGTPFLLQRPATPQTSGEAPKQAPIEAEGRLVRDSSFNADYDEAFATFTQRGEVDLVGGHLYVVMQGERPRTGWTVPLIFLGLAFLLAINVRSLVRTLR
ncbi:MAG: hypothetical protein LBM75_00530 [Myxococcales bacterium]|jgi:hypothetical protein|nr:hypothetical protein [Myxococcales bacterium]